MFHKQASIVYVHNTAINYNTHFTRCLVIIAIVFRRFRIQGTALTYGIASTFLVRQQFKAKYINRMTSLPLPAFFPCTRQHMSFHKTMEIELEELTVEELLNRISNDNSLRQAFISHLGRVTSSNDDSQAVHMSISANSLQATGSYQSGMYTSSPLHSSTHQSTTSLVAGVHQLENTNDPLATRVHQLGNTNDPLAAGAHQLGNTNDLLAAGREVQVTHWLLSLAWPDLFFSARRYRLQYKRPA